MKKFFKSTTPIKDDGWLQCHFGCSSIDTQDYVVTTHYLKGDEVPEEMNDAKTASELIAGLLNAYYNGINVADMPPDKVCAAGLIDQDGHDNPAQIKLPLDIQK